VTNILPSFLILGAPKAGTTSLYQYLSQHPQVFMSAHKEPKFFAFEKCDLNFTGPYKARKQIQDTTVVDIVSYQKLFVSARGQKAVGEASPIYLHNEQSAARIQHYLPDAKFIAILRNPVERAYSDWQHNFQQGFETLNDFRTALEAWDKRAQTMGIPYLNYIEKGYYAKHLERYQKYFSRDQFAIFLFEDLQNSPNNLLKIIFDFLEIDNSVKINTGKKFMVGQQQVRYTYFESALMILDNFLSGSKFGILDGMKTKIRDWYLIPQVISDSDYKWLLGYYRTDIEQLQHMLSRDLSGWLDPGIRRAAICD
jgi:hypothetical protein